MRTVYLYELREKNTGNPFYVGITKYPKQREATHIKCNGGKKISAKLKQLTKSGEGFDFVILAETTQTKVVKMEYDRILALRVNGFDLCNVRLDVKKVKGKDSEFMQIRKLDGLKDDLSRLTKHYGISNESQVVRLVIKEKVNSI